MNTTVEEIPVRDLIANPENLRADVGVEAPDDVRDDTTGKQRPLGERWDATWQRVVVDADLSKPATRNRMLIAILSSIPRFSATRQVQEYLAAFETT